MGIELYSLSKSKYKQDFRDSHQGVTLFLLSDHTECVE